MKIKLGANAESEKENGGVNFVYKSGSFPIKVDLGKEIFLLDPGDSVEGVKFDSYTIINTVAQVQEIEFYVTPRKLRGGGKESVKVAPNALFAGLPKISIDGTVQTVASNSSRKKVYLYADPDNLNVIWLGGVADSGIPLQPGGVFDEAISGQIQVLGTAGTDVLYCAEIE